MGTQQVCLILSLHLKVIKRQRDSAEGSPGNRRDTQTSHTQVKSELNIKEKLTLHTTV